VPADFVILEIEEDTLTPIILGRLFLATAGCRIDVKNGTLSFDVGDDHVEFNLLKAAKFPSITISNLGSNYPFEHLMLNNSTSEDENPDVVECAQLREVSPPILPSIAKVES